MPAKFPQKISEIVVTAFQTDFRNRQVRLFQKPECLLDSVFVDIFYGRLPDCLFEKPAEILLVLV